MTTLVCTREAVSTDPSSNLQLFANPYDFGGSGFYFTSFDEYWSKSRNNVNKYGQVVEEYEIDLIDGNELEIALFKAVKPNQATLESFFNACDNWDDHQMITAIIAFDHGIVCGGDFDLFDPDKADLCIREPACKFHSDPWVALADELVDEGFLGTIPDHLQNYIDLEAVARDLRYNGWFETTVGDRVFMCESW